MQITPPRAGLVALLGLAAVAGISDARSVEFARASQAAGTEIRCQGRVATIAGDGRSETLRGTDDVDVIVAGAGNDQVIGNAGADVICGGPGADRIVGGAGDDLCWGSGGSDRLVSCSPVFELERRRITGPLRRRVEGSSWHPGCPHPLSGLRMLRVSHWNFERDVVQGELIVDSAQAGPVGHALRGLFQARFPIRRMNLIDRYGADDHRSMNADNTSAFNCREVAGQPGVWSQHAYGRAIDLNPRENPYVTASGHVSPPGGAPYADRTRHAKGMIHRSDAVFEAFRRSGWSWGGDWPWPRDYQHFSSTGS